MSKSIDTVVWTVALALILAVMLVAMKRPAAHCHDGTCHTHGVK